MKVTEQFEKDAEGDIVRSIVRQWQVSVTSLGDPYYSGRCFVDPDARILAWLRVFRRSDPKADLVIDIRNLAEGMPFVWASGKPLILVVACPDGLRYAIWQPGMSDFHRYRPDPKKGQTLYDIYWDAVIPAAELKPLGRTLPEVLAESLSVRTIPVAAGAGKTPKKPSSAVPVGRARRKATQKSCRWPNIIQDRRNS
jgi:hypothetical protein